VVSRILFGEAFHRKAAALSNLLSPCVFVHTLGVVKSDLVPDLKDLYGFMDLYKFLKVCGSLLYQSLKYV
jgi:hypothetical protein